MADVSVNVRAYSKLLLHAAKYPHCAVNGLLLAEKPKDNKLRFVDCIPLFHITLGLAPMLEIALTQIDTYCKSKNLIIGGYYQANVNVDNNRPDHIASVVGRKIHDNCGDALLFMVDNSRLTVECEQEVYRIHQLKDTNWVELNKKHTIDEDCRDVSSELLKGREYRKLIDFDNHLDDMNQDWRNVEINQLLSQYGALSDCR